MTLQLNSKQKWKKDERNCCIYHDCFWKFM